MANTLTPVDVYAIVNDMAAQMFGKDAPKAVDTTSFVTIGESMLRTGYENTLNALSYAIGRTYFAVRPYTGKFSIINRTDEEYGLITRKISYFYDELEASGDWNTDLHQGLKDGQSVDHYRIRKRYPLEMTFAGHKVMQKSFTRFRKQLKVAFRNEDEFSRFYQGLLVEIANEIEIMCEAQDRLTVLNHIGATFNTGNEHMKVNLTKEFNERFGTQYSSEQLRTEHLKEFLAFFVSRIKYASDMMEENNTLFHITPVKNNDGGNPLTLLRHTPKSMQRLLLLSPLFIDAEAQVMPEIFNPRYLDVADGERVNYWQNPAEPGVVNVTPNQLNPTTGQAEDGAAVNIPYVVGMLFDRDALATVYRTEDVITTPVNAVGDYYNTVYHWAKDFHDDQTENTIIFYMMDEPGGRTAATCAPTKEKK